MGAEQHLILSNAAFDRQVENQKGLHGITFAPHFGKIATEKGGIHEKSIDHLGDTRAADLGGERSQGGDLSALFAGPELVRVVSEMPCGLLQFVLFRIGAADRETHLFLLHPHLPELRIFQMQKDQVRDEPIKSRRNSRDQEKE